MLLKNSALFLLLAFAMQSFSHGQGLADISATQGLDFGFLVTAENLGALEYRNVVLDEANVATVTAYWKLQTRPRANVYDFSAPDAVVAFAIDNNLKIHGHPLLWAHDDFIPRWVKRISSAADAEAALLDHIATTAGRYRGLVSLWHVVNEAFIYTGERRDSYWQRKLGDNFIELAFTAARDADPDALLIYNDFGLLELDERKYQAVKAQLLQMRSNNVAIDGLGWQCHLKVDQVLSDDFPMEERMQEMSLLGFTNYITELDIELPSNSPADLERQAEAYRKIADIFARILDRGAMQTWDVSDRQSWLGTAAAPLIFDEDYNPKPAYFELVDAFLPAAEEVVVEEPVVEEPVVEEPVVEEPGRGGTRLDRGKGPGKPKGGRP